MEEGSLSRTLTFDCGRGCYAQEEYATKSRERGESEEGANVVRSVCVSTEASVVTGHDPSLLGQRWTYRITAAAAAAAATLAGWFPLPGPRFTKYHTIYHKIIVRSTCVSDL